MLKPSLCVCVRMLQKNDLQLDRGWDPDHGFNTIALLFTVSAVIIICLMVLSSQQPVGRCGH